MSTDYNYKPKKSKDDFGWYGLKRLPHLDADETVQFVTFRLADSIPLEMFDRWRTEASSEAAFRKRVEKYLDGGRGECILQIREVATVVRDSLLFFDGKRYRLIAWVIMPNHVHLLLDPMPSEHLPDIMHSIKSFTANKINKLLGRRGQVWQHESFDRYIRDARHFAATLRYIEQNPVRAALCSQDSDWEFGSAFVR